MKLKKMANCYGFHICYSKIINKDTLEDVILCKLGDTNAQEIKYI